MNKSLNYVLNSLNLRPRCSLYYSFNNYSGDLILGDPSIGTGTLSPGLSGRVNPYASSTLADFTGASGSGNFSAGYIEVGETTTVNPRAFNLLISQEKTGAGEATLFSNIDEANKSGYLVGIDPANHLYFKYYNQGEPAVYSYILPTNSNKNIYQVNLSPIGLLFSRFDGKTERFAQAQRYNIPNTYWLQSNSNFIIGSGDNDYKGTIDEILLYSGQLGGNTPGLLASSFYKSYNFTQAVTGYVSGSVTGYSSGYYQTTGIIGSSGELSGYNDLTGTLVSVAGTGLLTGSGPSGTSFFTPLTGTWYSYEPFRGESGYYASGLYLTPPAHFYYESGFTGAGLETGITGFNFTSGTIDTTGASFPVYSGVNITGVTSSGYNLTGLTGAAVPYIATGAVASISGSLPAAYYPLKMIYQGQRLTGDPLVEKKIFSDLSSYSLNQPFAERAVGQSSTIYSFYTREVLEPSGTMMSINGQTLFPGQLSRSARFGQPLLSISGDYAATGRTSRKTTQFYTTLFPLGGMPVDALYDKNQTGERGSLAITGTGQYTSAPFSEINITGTEVFFNGIKLYSGINYINKAGGFQPTGAITGSTGDYFYHKNEAAYYSATGNTYDFSGVHLNDASAVVYVNGVRGNKEDYYYGSSVDLVASGYDLTYPTNWVEIFNNNE